MRKLFFVFASVALWSLASGQSWSQQATSGANQGSSGANATSSPNQGASPTGANAPGTALNRANQNNQAAGISGTDHPGTYLNQTNPNKTNQGPGSELNRSTNGQTNSSADMPGREMQPTNAQQRIQEQRLEDRQRLDSEYMFRNGTAQGTFRDDPSQRNMFGNQQLQNENETQGNAHQQLDRNSAIDRLRRGGRQIDDWRVVEQNGRLWYWTPQRSWMVYNNGNWSPYRRGMRSGVGAASAEAISRGDLAYPDGYPSEEWRLVNHNNRWWYWTPDETWLYRNDNRWNPYRNRSTTLRQNRAQQRYSTGYRGADDNVYDNDRTYHAEPFNGQRGSDQQLRQRTIQNAEPQSSGAAAQSVNGTGAGMASTSTPARGAERTPQPQPEEPSIEGGRGPSDVSGSQVSPADGGSQAGGNSATDRGNSASQDGLQGSE